MDHYTYKTSLKCEGCVEAITSALNAVKGVIDWNVKLEDHQRKLEVFSENASEDEIIKAVRDSGYSIEKII